MSTVPQIKAKAYAAFKPTARDQYVTIAYEYEAMGRTHTSMVSDRWMRAKSRIAASCLIAGVHEFRITMGVGTRRRRFQLTCTDAEAMAFLDDWADRDFFGFRHRAWVQKQRAARLRAEKIVPDGTLEAS